MHVILALTRSTAASQLKVIVKLGAFVMKLALPQARRANPPRLSETLTQVLFVHSIKALDRIQLLLAAMLGSHPQKKHIHLQPHIPVGCSMFGLSRGQTAAAVYRN